MGERQKRKSQSIIYQAVLYRSLPNNTLIHTATASTIEMRYQQSTTFKFDSLNFAQVIVVTSIGIFEKKLRYIQYRTNANQIRGDERVVAAPLACEVSARLNPFSNYK